jgi:ElaB/YqjD/DUF883 family membrane-anchored ribosome-binding protein
MNTKTMDSINTSNAAPKEKLMEDLRLVVEDADELLRATTNQAREGAATVGALIRESLQVVKERLVAAETAVIERTRQSAKVTGQYVHDNAWNWH